FWSPAAGLLFASCLSRRLTGSTSKPVRGSACMRTGPWPAPQSCWRFIFLPPPCPPADVGCPRPLTGADHHRTSWHTEECADKGEDGAEQEGLPAHNR